MFWKRIIVGDIILIWNETYSENQLLFGIELQRPNKLRHKQMNYSHKRKLGSRYELMLWNKLFGSNELREWNCLLSKNELS